MNDVDDADDVVYGDVAYDTNDIGGVDGDDDDDVIEVDDTEPVPHRRPSGSQSCLSPPSPSR